MIGGGASSAAQPAGGYDDWQAIGDAIDAAARPASSEPRAEREARIFGERITHGRHCTCTPCARQDWTLPYLAPCGMHGPDCPREYQPWGGAGTFTKAGRPASSEPEAEATTDGSDAEMSAQVGSGSLGAEAAPAQEATFVDGIGPPLEQITEDYAALDDDDAIIGARHDVLALIAEVKRLRAAAVPADAQADAALIREAVGYIGAEAHDAEASAIRNRAWDALDRLVAALPGTAE